MKKSLLNTISRRNSMKTESSPTHSFNIHEPEALVLFAIIFRSSNTKKLFPSSFGCGGRKGGKEEEQEEEGFI